MMASRRPDLLGGVGEGAQAGLREAHDIYRQGVAERYRNDQLGIQNRRLGIEQQRADAAKTRAAAPHIDQNAEHLRLIYPDGRVAEFPDMPNLSAKRLDLEGKRVDLEGKRVGLETTRAAKEKYSLYPGEGLDDQGNRVPGSYRFNTNTGEREFLPGVTLTRRAGTSGGTLTAAQAATNAQIDEARKTLDSMGFGPGDLTKFSQRQINGRDNPDFKPGISSMVSKATRRKVGVDDSEFGATWGKVYGTGTPAGGSPPSSSASPSAAGGAGYVGDDIANGKRVHVYKKSDGTFYGVPY